MHKKAGLAASQAACREDGRVCPILCVGVVSLERAPPFPAAVPGALGRLGKKTTLTEQVPEETVALVASDADPAELPDELIARLGPDRVAARP